MFHPQITALSKVLRLPIEVIQADGPSIIAGEHYDTEPLLLTYVVLLSILYSQMLNSIRVPITNW